MSNDIPLPDELKLLIEKRDDKDRRKADEPEKVPEGVDRRKKDRRKDGSQS